MAGPGRLSVGLPRMHKERGERRDFLPAFVARLARKARGVVVEHDVGAGMGLDTADYIRIPGVRIDDHVQAYSQDVVMVLRAPSEEEMGRMRPGATLVSMLHFPTRPARVQLLHELGLEAVSLDSIEDDAGRRIVFESEAVAWNGVEAAFDALERTYARFADPARPPIRVTVMGPGAIGRHAVEAAAKYGSARRLARMESRGLPGVEVVAIGRSLTRNELYLRGLLATTDVLVDATCRDDPSRALVPNEWIGLMPRHAVICDLVVDPYQLDTTPPTVRAIEGIPQGNLDRFVFGPDDPAWGDTIPPGIPCGNRRTVVSCYSWPGVHPRRCMEQYDEQLGPLLETLLARGGVTELRWDGSAAERALLRGSFRSWAADHAVAPTPVPVPIG